MPPLTNDNMWWIGQIEEISARSRGFLWRHFPGISESHDDIVSEVKTQLAELLTRSRDDFPSSWYATAVPDSEQEREYLFQLAHTILKRRIADHFRERSSIWAKEIDIADVPENELQSDVISHDVKLGHEKLLKSTLEFIQALPDEDQLLVARLADAGNQKTLPLTPTERQRIHRLRKRLIEMFRERFGENVISMLRED